MASSPIESRWIVTAPPHMAGPDSTPRIMWTVVLSLLPALLFGFARFGISSVMVVLAAILGCAAAERMFGSRKQSLLDGSCLITGILLGMTLPPGMPMWMAFVGGVFGIGAGKMIFGGLGNNIFNPALLGRAFLQAAFPVAITTFPKGGGSFFTLVGDTFALPLMRPNLGEGGIDVITEATPMGLMKFDQEPTAIWNLFLGSTSGSLGETSAILILLGGLYLAWRNYLNWRIPLAIFTTVFALGSLLWMIGIEAYPASPMFLLGTGGMVLGAMYMATDMVTSPVTNLGAYLFGIGIAIMVVVIRVWGGLSEGMMYAILFMNALVPFINRKTQPRVFGTKRGLKTKKPEATS